MKTKPIEFLDYVYLVDIIAASWCKKTPLDYDDLRSIGLLGLHDAIEKYQEISPFTAYARLRINGAILDELRRVEGYSRYSGPSKFFHLDQPIGDDELDPYNLLPPSGECSRTGAIKTETSQRLRNARKWLTDQENLMVEMNFFGDYTRKDIAEVVGLTPSRVSQIMRGALKKMSMYMEKTDDSQTHKTHKTQCLQ